MVTQYNPRITHTSSIFAEITARAKSVNAVNLGQGFPDFDTPDDIKEVAIQAIRDGHNQYAMTHGEGVLREALAEHSLRFYNHRIHPDSDICVTAGASEALWCAITALVSAGDEVIVFEPTFDVYAPTIRLVGGVLKPLILRAPDFRINIDELRATITNKTRLLILNTPHNPTGMCCTHDELTQIAALCVEYNILVISDEVYEHIVFAPHKHKRIATLEGMEQRTITISSGGKTFSSTGWKCGWAIGAKNHISAIRKVHQFTVFASSTPFQYAIAYALRKDDSFFADLATMYHEKKEYLTNQLKQTPLTVYEPEGAYFITTDISSITSNDGVWFASWLIDHCKVAVIPSQVFYSNQNDGRTLVRWCFCKKNETLHQAVRLIGTLNNGPIE